MSFTQNESPEDLQIMSKRIKSNPNIISQLNKFYESTLPNENRLRMIEQNNSATREQGSKKVIDKSSNHAMTNYKQPQKKVYQLERKTPFKQDFPFCGIVVKLFVLTFVVFFAADFYSELQTERERKTNEITKCYQDYHQNNCITPLEALIEECQRLEFCASRDPIKMTKASDVFVNSVLGLFSKLITQLTYIGVGLIVLLLAVYLYRPSMYHEEKIHKFQ